MTPCSCLLLPLQLGCKSQHPILLGTPESRLHQWKGLRVAVLDVMVRPLQALSGSGVEGGDNFEQRMPRLHCGCECWLPLHIEVHVCHQAVAAHFPQHAPGKGSSRSIRVKHQEFSWARGGSLDQSPAHGRPWQNTVASLVGRLDAPMGRLDAPDPQCQQWAIVVMVLVRVKESSSGDCFEEEVGVGTVIGCTCTRTTVLCLLLSTTTKHYYYDYCCYYYWYHCTCYGCI